MSKTSWAWMRPAVTCRTDRRTARDTLKASVLKNITSFAQVEMMFFEIAVLTWGAGK